MLLFLYGPDDYRRFQKKQDLAAEFKKKHSDLGIGSFDFENKDAIESFQNFVRNQSIFETAKLALVENAFEMEAKQLAKLLRPFLQEKSINVLLSERDKPVKTLSFLIEKPAFFQKFENLEGATWEQFVVMAAQKHNVALDADAVKFLATVYEGNTWGLVTELQKLSALKSTINKKDLEQLNLEAAPNYWALLNGVKNADVRTRLYAFEKLLALNDPPAKLFNMLASQWQQKLRRFAEFDFLVKSGKLEYEEVLLEAVLE